MKRDHRLFIKDIIDAMESIEKFVEGMSFENLLNDDKTSSAVIRKKSLEKPRETYQTG